MARQYFKATPNISNIWNGIKHAYNGWIDTKTGALIGEPTILPGKFPKLESLYGIEQGTKAALKMAREYLKRDNLKPFIGTNGQQYVRTKNGVKSLINYSAENFEKTLGAPYGENLNRHYTILSNKNALMIKDRFGSTFSPLIKVREVPTQKASQVKKVESLYSKNKAFDANQIK